MTKDLSDRERVRLLRDTITLLLVASEHMTPAVPGSISVEVGQLKSNIINLSWRANELANALVPE